MYTCITYICVCVYTDICIFTYAHVYMHMYAKVGFQMLSFLLLVRPALGKYFWFFELAKIRLRNSNLAF